jgi:ribosomal-protein-alanine N-acetyltransferase
MTPEELAALHARCFAHAPRPWSASEFASLLTSPTAIAVLRPHGFAIGRIAGTEAELLTIAVEPAARRRGLGAALVEAYEYEAGARDADASFLEVAETNDAARALYARLGYAPVGRRPGYYVVSGAPPVAAQILRKSLADAPPIA